ncbi:phage recombination protein Bet [Solilutibacter silvestris]|uniref:phage recombination protein Bet n=1 Tax=Solilutibacter silvestris TaxID=1645665 RepID=UPI003D326D5C
MNAVATIPRNNNALTITEHQAAIWSALKSSIYPGASDNSISLVLDYCTAAGLDPMQKPVHIVPMWDGNSRTMRDVVMPGIGLYRVQASRSGQFAGMSEPVFGPMVTEKIGSVDVTFPEWCRVTAYRQLANGHIAEFTAVEYWIENYAIKGGKEKDQSPNAMWSKRVRGQIAKCAQAQALRMAFPEIGSQPTAEEMEGKSIIDGEAVVVQQARAEKPAYSQTDFDKNLPTWRDLIASGKKSADQLIATLQSKATFTDEQLAAIRAPFAVDGSPEVEDEIDWSKTGTGDQA